jgi:hypothetical protein
MKADTIARRLQFFEMQFTDFIEAEPGVYDVLMLLGLLDRVTVNLNAMGHGLIGKWLASRGFDWEQSAELARELADAWEISDSGDDDRAHKLWDKVVTMVEGKDVVKLPTLAGLTALRKRRSVPLLSRKAWRALWELRRSRGRASLRGNGRLKRPIGRRAHQS